MAPDSVAFERPPVREVALTVYFDPIREMTVSSLSRLLRDWGSDDATIEEQLPLRSRYPHDSVAATTSGYPFGRCPLVTLTFDTGESVAIQNDRLVKRWIFSGSDVYPGFDALSRDLEQRFEDFTETAQNLYDVRPDPIGASCEYVNEIGEISPRQLMLGVLTNWRVGHEVSAEPAAKYVGMHLHYQGVPGFDDCVLRVTIDGDDNAAESVLTLDAQTATEPRDEPLGGLGYAHDALIQGFVSVTSEQMHTQWGRRK